MSKNSVWSIFSSRPLSCKVLFSCTLYIMYLSFVCYLGDFPRPYCSCTDVTFLDHTAVVLVVWLSQIILQLYWRCDFARPYCSCTGGVTFLDRTAVVQRHLYWWCDCSSSRDYVASWPLECSVIYVNDYRNLQKQKVMYSLRKTETGVKSRENEN